MRRSTRQKLKTKQPYIPPTSGSKYKTAMAQMENQVALNTYVHMFFKQVVE